MTLWTKVAEHLDEKMAHMAAADAQAPGSARLNAGQRTTIAGLAQRLPHNGIVLADEVGMGKTRVAVELIESVVRCGGRVAVLIPPGLGYQWQRELADGGVVTEHVLRSVVSYTDAWHDENPATHWPERRVVVVSHAFCNWKIKATADARRWALLPGLVAAWQESQGHPSVDRRVARVRALSDASLRAGRRIVKELGEDAAARQAVAAFAGQAVWEQLMRPSEYQGDSDPRRWLQQAVGLGLGRFDLVVIDEAHKNRGEEGGLSTLLRALLQTSPQCRHVALSATPVELEPEQWIGTLARIRVPETEFDGIREAIAGYTENLKRVRRSWRTSAEARKCYAEAAATFAHNLGRFVLRRDKREDEAVRLYDAQQGTSGRNYRDTTLEVKVETARLSLPWKRAVCAAEALSVALQPGDRMARRLRLTLASGHGTAVFLDARKEDEVALKNGEEKEVTAQEDAAALRRAERSLWWRDALLQSLLEVDDPLYEHPALKAAVHRIESYTQGDCTKPPEKVLVFGRYTRPLQALEQLLNARELLRRLAEGKYWPQSHLRTDVRDQRPAVRAAYRQWEAEHHRPHPIPLQGIDAALAKQFGSERYARRTFREALLERLSQGLTDIGKGQERSAMALYASLCAGLLTAATRAQPSEEDGHPIALLARALLDMTGGGAVDMAPADLAREFMMLVDAVLENDAGSEDDEAEPDPDQTWAGFSLRLSDEFGARAGEFARLMYGDTKHESRRIIQQAFNRDAAYPMVLIAQSMVGREGLNLHQACRVVVLLHPEWNPAVVEQQIGRVDRVGSRWAKQLQKDVADDKASDELPRIEILPVVFEGTYDEHNWRVLRDRWDDLRAQLHGEVIPPRTVPAVLTEQDQELLQALKQAAPRFSWQLP